MNSLPRRTFLASASAALGSVLVGASSSAAGEAAPHAPLGLEFALSVTCEIEPAIQMGQTPHGSRRVIVIRGGTFEGPRLKGTVMPGGEDWQVTRPDGVTELDARYWLKAEDGAIIRVHNRCLIAPTADGEPYIRTSPQFEAPLGPHDWLNKAIFVGTLTAKGPQPKAVTLHFYKVT